MYRYIAKSIASVTGLAFIMVSLVLMATPGYTFATRIEVRGNSHGLSVSPSGPLFAENNMVPGDSVASTVVIRNEHPTQGQGSPLSFEVVMSVEKEGPGSDELLAALYLRVIGTDSKVYYDGPMNSVTNVRLGSIPNAQERELALLVSFSAQAANPLQGKSVTVKWVFDATRVMPPLLPPPPIVPPVTPPPGEIIVIPSEGEIVIVPEPEIPTGPLVPEVQPEEPVEPEPDDKGIVIITDDPIPGGPTVLPKTGETPRVFFLLGGLALIAVGLMIRTSDKKAA